MIYIYAYEKTIILTHKKLTIKYVFSVYKITKNNF